MVKNILLKLLEKEELIKNTDNIRNKSLKDHKIDKEIKTED